MRTKGETPVEEMERAVANFVNSIEDLQTIATPQDWLSFVQDNIQSVSMSGNPIKWTPASAQFWLNSSAALETALGIKVTKSESTGQTVFRLAAGHPGAGTFTSRDDVMSRLAGLKGLFGRGI